MVLNNAETGTVGAAYVYRCVGMGYVYCKDIDQSHLRIEDSVHFKYSQFEQLYIIAVIYNVICNACMVPDRGLTFCT